MNCRLPIYRQPSYNQSADEYTLPHLDANSLCLLIGLSYKAQTLKIVNEAILTNPSLPSIFKLKADIHGVLFHEEMGKCYTLRVVG